jgi:hypothetical protein
MSPAFRRDHHTRGTFFICHVRLARAILSPVLIPFTRGRTAAQRRSESGHQEGSDMKTARSAKSLHWYVAGVVAAAGGLALQAAADEGPSAAAASHHQSAGNHKPDSSEFIRTVRRATARFRDVAVAEAEGYELHFGCVSGPDNGAMGLHYVNMALVGDGKLDPEQPEIVIYEPLPNGRLRLIGADFLVLADAWHANNAATPELGGQLLHLFESPNRFGLPNFYTLHVWAWKDNPTGTFVNWHANVSCDSFSG